MNNIRLDVQIHEDVQKDNLEVEKSNYVDQNGMVELALKDADYYFAKVDYRFADRIVELINGGNNE